jgi:hypothetical protein
MTSEELINKLVAEPRPSAKVLTPSVLTFIWAALAGAGSLLVNYFLFAFRPDLHEALENTLYGIGLASLAGMAWLGARLAIESGYPGRPVKAIKLRGLILLAVVFFATIFTRFLHLDVVNDVKTGSAFAGCQCTYTLLILGCLPAVALFLSLRRLAPINPRLTGWMLGLATGASGALVLAFDCSVGSPTHQLIYHALPIIGLAFIVGKLGPKLLHW